MLSAHVFFVFESQWRGSKDCSRATAAFHCKNDPGHIHPSTEPSQASCSEQSSEHDKSHENLYRRCTANVRRNPHNRLKRLCRPRRDLNPCYRRESGMAKRNSNKLQERGRTG